MKRNPLFWQWVGYLSNPIRRTDIHAEMHPGKEREFREKYFELTREPILLSGKSAPFYVWPESADKYGKQLRVYFTGKREATPETPKPLRVTGGRTANGLRVNGNEFVFNLFSVGFSLGKNTNNLQNIKPNVPSKFKKDFLIGLSKMSNAEEMENLVLEHYKRNGTLTEKSKNLRKLWKKKHAPSAALLDELCANKTLVKNNNEDSYSLLNIERLRGEIENKLLRRAIDSEQDSNKREILMETYVRDRGWIRLAKATFGDVCMFDGCQNSFRKENGENYIETHHIKSLSDGGKDYIENLVMLCAHHHRMAHFANRKVRDQLRSQFQQKNRDCLSSIRL